MNEISLINPDYYRSETGLEAIQVIEGYGLSFHLGNAVKYVFRAGKKPGNEAVKDYTKALWNVKRAIEHPRHKRTSRDKLYGTGSFIPLHVPDPRQVLNAFPLPVVLEDAFFGFFHEIMREGQVSDDSLADIVMVTEIQIKQMGLAA